MDVKPRDEVLLSVAEIVINSDVRLCPRPKENAVQVEGGITMDQSCLAPRKPFRVTATRCQCQCRKATSAVHAN